MDDILTIYESLNQRCPYLKPIVLPVKLIDIMDLITNNGEKEMEFMLFEMMQKKIKEMANKDIKTYEKEDENDINEGQDDIPIDDDMEMNENEEQYLILIPEIDFKHKIIKFIEGKYVNEIEYGAYNLIGLTAEAQGSYNELEPYFDYFLLENKYENDSHSLQLIHEIISLAYSLEILLKTMGQWNYQLGEFPLPLPQGVTIMNALGSIFHLENDDENDDENNNQNNNENNNENNMIIENNQNDNNITDKITKFINNKDDDIISNDPYKEINKKKRKRKKKKKN